MALTLGDDTRYDRVVDAASRNHTPIQNSSQSSSVIATSPRSNSGSHTLSYAIRLAANKKRHPRLPTPPDSTRPSLENPSEVTSTPHLAFDPDHWQTPAGHSDQSASPPPSPPLSPAPVSLEYIISQVRDVLTGKAAVRKISNVTSELYQQLDAQAQVDVDLAGWDGVKWVYSGTVHDLVGVSILTLFSSRVDFHRGDLIVGGKVSFGNEIMTALFLDLQRDNTSYPIHYGTSQIRTFGQANIDLTVGSKSPDYALYEVVEDENSTNITPTIAWEIEYAENERKLEMDAARLICLSKGLVQLVVTVKITHEPNTFPKMLKRVVWHHWEMDAARFGQVDDPTNTLLLNNPVPHPQGDQTSPPSYEAHVEIDEDIYRLVAHVTKSYQV